MPFAPPEHKTHHAEARKHSTPRASSHARGYTKRWRKAREYWLMHHPLCVHCLADGRAIEATDLDHKIPHRGDMRLFWDHDNWQSLCHSHHSAKTAREDGGFGN